MEPLLESLLWCVAQVTLVGLLAWALCAAVGRWRQAATAALPTTALLAVVLLTACAFVPWPSWWRYGPRLQAAGRAVEVDQPTSNSAPAAAPLRTLDEGFSPLAIESSPAIALPREASPTNLPPQPAASQSPVASTSSLSVAANLRIWLPIGLAAVVALGALLGAAQLAGGLISVRAHRRCSQPLDDAELAEVVDCLRAELSLTHVVELRESDQLATAATIGWMRPAILLPGEWRGWTADQLRAVLAHELAHVSRGDYLACVLAQVGVAMHFYHPLVHWLAARLRLEQELAADRTAAQLAGGPKSYLQSLAELALHTTERPLGWPAHTFLPTQGTFLRRIEMLRDSKPGGGGEPLPTIGSWPRWVAVGLLIAGAAGIAGLRGGPTASAQAPAATPAAVIRPASGDAGEGIDLTHVTNDAQMILAIRPAQIMAQPEIRSALEAALEGGGPSLLKLLATKDVRQVTLIGPPGVEPDDWNRDAVIVVQFAESASFEAISQAGIWPADAVRLPGEGGSRNAPPQQAYSILDDRTLALGSTGVLPRYLANRRKGQPAIATGSAWEKVQTGAIVAAVDMELIREQFRGREPGTAAAGPGAALATLSPLWTDSEYVLAGVIIEGKTVHLRAIATCHDAMLAENVAETAQAAITLTRNMMRSSRQNQGEVPQFAVFLLDTADGLLKSVKVERNETLVVAQTKTEVPEASTAAAGQLLGAISKAREGAQRAQSANNMKQLLLGLHNWADTRGGGQFPPPVVYGRDGKGKVPHSWRIELLPYIEQAPLYEAYKFDEPWDSEANKKVLAQMPPVFRHPQDDPKSTNASYFVLRSAKLLVARPAPEGGTIAPEGGFATAFSAEGGMPFAQVIDGLSNTLAIVEARRDIPWTRPDDIQFNSAKDPPELGGFFKEGFHAALCDGSVRFIKETIEPATLKLLIMPQDGMPVPNF